MRMTKEDVLAFRVADRVHILKGPTNATIVDRKEIHEEDRNVIAIELTFEFGQGRPVDRHVFTFDSEHLG